MNEHSLINDGLENYSCACGRGWRYTHVGPESRIMAEYTKHVREVGMSAPEPVEDIIARRITTGLTREQAVALIHKDIEDGRLKLLPNFKLVSTYGDVPQVSEEYRRGYNDAARVFLASPPDGWTPFGSSIDPETGKGPGYELEFSGDDGGGLPIWERPATGKIVEWGWTDVTQPQWKPIKVVSERVARAVVETTSTRRLVRREVTEWVEVRDE